MTKTILGNHLIHPSEIKVNVGSLAVLHSGEVLKRKEIVLYLDKCKACGEKMYTKEELNLQQLIGKCFTCTTGNRSDFSTHNSCRCVHKDRVAEAKNLIWRYTGDHTDFWRTQPYYGAQMRLVEIHFTWRPLDAFIRIGYHAFRFLHDLTKEEAEQAVHAFIHGSFENLLKLTHPPYLAWKKERDASCVT